MSENTEDRPFTVARMQKRLDELRTCLGAQHDVTFMVQANRWVKPGWCCLMVTQASMAAKVFNASSFDGALSDAYEWAHTHVALLRNTITRRMALAIIESTDEHGKCTETHLLGRLFSADDIATYRDAACARASEMVGNTPFEVVK